MIPAHCFALPICKSWPTGARRAIGPGAPCDRSDACSPGGPDRVAQRLGGLEDETAAADDARLDQLAGQAVGLADKGGDEARLRLLVDLLRRAQLLDRAS